jgi:hypothetical protein
MGAVHRRSYIGSVLGVFGVSEWSVRYDVGHDVSRAPDGRARPGWKHDPSNTLHRTGVFSRCMHRPTYVFSLTFLCLLPQVERLVSSFHSGESQFQHADAKHDTNANSSLGLTAIMSTLAGDALSVFFSSHLASHISTSFETQYTTTSHHFDHLLPPPCYRVLSPLF